LHFVAGFGCFSCMSTKQAAEKYGQIHPKTSVEWRDWLLQHHAASPGVWLVSNKKTSGLPQIGAAGAIEEALCFGWVDSLPRSFDADRSMILMTPRKLNSNWSAVNKERATRMIAEGRMMPAGLAKIDFAKANGQWDALNAVEALEIPADLQAALDAYPNSNAFFEAFPRSAKRGILEWILSAKTAETRAKRLEETARLAAANIRANQWRQPKGAT
jgi:uncharacterized protein YdeI (YjbR/CyaY-like superfamily)